jgi:EamA domain-containing membrane protein RarD
MLASSQIAMRQMRKMNHNTVTAYQNITLLAFACVMLYLQNSNYDFMLTFDWQSWLLLIVIGVVTILHQNVKMIAFRYEDPSKLQTIAFLPNILQFSIDWIILNADFTAQQFWGFGLLFAFNTIELVRFRLQ